MFAHHDRPREISPALQCANPMDKPTFLTSLVDLRFLPLGVMVLDDLWHAQKNYHNSRLSSLASNKDTTESCAVLACPNTSIPAILCIDACQSQLHSLSQGQQHLGESF